jgi:hypothetical protein
MYGSDGLGIACYMASVNRGIKISNIPNVLEHLVFHVEKEEEEEDTLGIEIHCFKCTILKDVTYKPYASNFTHCMVIALISAVVVC